MGKVAMEIEYKCKRYISFVAVVVLFSFKFFHEFRIIFFFLPQLFQESSHFPITQLNSLSFFFLKTTK